MADFNWENYLNFAQYLIENDLTGLDEETKFRNVVSRAYYAAYHAGKQYKSTKEPEVSTGAAHEELYLFFRNLAQRYVHLSTTYNSIANDLKNLKIRRHTADYEKNSETSFSKKDARTNYFKASGIIKKINNLK